MLSIFFCGDGVCRSSACACVAGAKKTGFPTRFRLRGGLMAPIHEAVRKRDVEALRRELERGVDPDLRVSETDYRTPLQLLPRSFECSAEILQCHRLLLENGASVDARDSINDTALHDACLFGNSALRGILLSSLRILIF